MGSIRGFSRILSKFLYNLLRLVRTSPILENTYFEEHLLMAAFIRFGSICFSGHFKVAAAFFIKQPCYFFLEKILFKESPQKTRTFILTFNMKENSIIAFHVFMVTFYAYTLQKPFFTDET